MISFEDARAAVWERAAPVGRPVAVSLAKAAGYFLATDVKAPEDIPNFDNAAMDGYAVRAADVACAADGSPVNLRLVGESAAGRHICPPLGWGEAVRVFTGGMLPVGADAVVMQEFCKAGGGKVAVSRTVVTGENVRRRGEEFRAGDRLLAAGTLITPAVVGLAAAAGERIVKVYPKPRVSLIVTGEELVRPGVKRGPGKIYDSNSFALSAALGALGLRAGKTLFCGDEENVLTAALQEALAVSDVVITTGGVSVGDYDFVPRIAGRLGVIVHFHKVAIKPGKPLFFGSLGGTSQDGGQLLFGLPGNPVAALVTYHQFVKPALLKMMGALDPGEDVREATLTVPLKKKVGRLEFVRGRLGREGGKLVVRPTRAQESHMLGGLVAADCLIHFPAEAERLAPGERVTVTVLRWGIQ